MLTKYAHRDWMIGEVSLSEFFYYYFYLSYKYCKVQYYVAIFRLSFKMQAKCP